MRDDVVSWVTQMRLSAPSPPQLFLLVRQISHVWLLKTPSPPFLVRHQPHPHPQMYLCQCREKYLFSHWLIFARCCRCQPEEQQPLPLSEVWLLLHGHKQGEDAQESRAYSLGLQCNICNGPFANKKSKRGSRGTSRIMELKKISAIECFPGGGTQAAAPKAGQHHGCRWSFLSDVNSINFLCREFCSVNLFTYQYFSGFEKFTPTQYCSTPGCSHNGKQTHYHCRSASLSCI